MQDPDTGEMVKSWQEVAQVWAGIEPLSAREFIQSAALQSAVSTRITIRHRVDVRASWRLVHLSRGTIYDIAGVLADKESGLEYLTLPCSEGTNEGG